MKVYNKIKYDVYKVYVSLKFIIYNVAVKLYTIYTIYI